MNRRIIALTIVAIAALGLTGCSGSSNTDPGKSEPAASAPADQKESPAAEAEQSVADACVAIAGPLADASQKMAGLSNAASDPQAAVDVWTELAKGFENAATTVSNADVKAATAKVSETVAAVRDQIKKVFVDKDTSAMTAYTQATTDMQTAYSAMTKLCTA